MRNSLLPILALATLAGAGVPNKFSSGKAAVAQDVNDNFTYLDTNLTKKADKDTLAALKDAINALKTGKADATVKVDVDATRSDLNALQTKQKADSATLATRATSGLTVATMNSSLANLRDSVGKRKDSAWIVQRISDTAKVVKAGITPQSIGALPASGGPANALAKWINVSTLGSSGITDDGSTITLGRKTTVQGMTAYIFPSTSTWGSLYGIGVTPSATNYAFSVANDGHETALNSTAQTNLQVNGASILTANAAGVKVNVGTLALAPATTGYASLNIPEGNASSAPDVVGNVQSDGAYLYVAGLGVGSRKGASDICDEGAAIRVQDAQPPDKIWQLQLGAGNTLDFWNFDRPTGGWVAKPLIQFTGNGSASFKGNIDALGLIKGGSVQVTNALDVGGDIKVAGSLKTAPGSVKSSDVADYVFEPSYKLSALSEVEAFAKEHKHLPEVPSATEIEQGGLDLAKMNLVLLKKVEELTLHAIEQQKAIEQQRQEMTFVKAELKAIKRD